MSSIQVDGMMTSLPSYVLQCMESSPVEGGNNLLQPYKILVGFLDK